MQERRRDARGSSRARGNARTLLPCVCRDECTSSLLRGRSVRPRSVVCSDMVSPPGRRSLRGTLVHAARSAGACHASHPLPHASRAAAEVRNSVKSDPGLPLHAAVGNVLQGVVGGSFFLPSFDSARSPTWICTVSAEPSEKSYGVEGRRLPFVGVDRAGRAPRTPQHSIVRHHEVQRVTLAYPGVTQCHAALPLASVHDRTLRVPAGDVHGPCGTGG